MTLKSNIMGHTLVITDGVWLVIDNSMVYLGPC